MSLDFTHTHDDRINTHSTMLTNLEAKQPENQRQCKPILPLPLEMRVTPYNHMEDDENVQIFRLKTNYTKKLKEATCSTVYRRMNMTTMKDALKAGTVIHPEFVIAPMKTSITMIKPETVFSMTKDNYNAIQKLASQLPVNWNWMDTDFISRPFNQGLCGSCWAVAASTTLSDVFAVSKTVPSNPNLSPTYLLSCLPQYQCDGGDPSKAVRDMSKYGIGPSSCVDYSWCEKTGCSGDPTKHFDASNVNKYIPKCGCPTQPKTASKQTTKYFATNTMSVCIPPNLKDFNTTERQYIQSYLSSMYGNVSSTNIDLSKEPIANIQAMIKYYIKTYGPAVVGFHVFANFMKGKFTETGGVYVENYAYSGVPGLNYKDPEGSWVGSHAVSLVGWGQTTIKGEVVNYWVVRNSWGTNWGNKGTFNMAMYGNDPKKKYQNRISQFEYPSVMETDNGIGITGGIIFMQAGKIEQNGLVVVNTKLAEDVPLHNINIETLDNEENTESLDNQENTESLYNQENIESLYNQENIESLYNQENIESTDNQKNIESTDNQENTESLDNKENTESPDNQESPDNKKKRYKNKWLSSSSLYMLIFIVLSILLYYSFTEDSSNNNTIILKITLMIIILVLLFELLK